ncbi:MAG: M28 family peptidase [Planctomycetes bacterium]|nr:M28 family peptidase [Planctomycetota bacterium]
MRASTAMALAAAVLGACLGAALIDGQPQHEEKAKGGGAPAAGTALPQRPALGVCIDRRRVLPLTAVRAPTGLGDAAFEHVRRLVAFGPRYSGTPGWTQQLDYIDHELKQLGLQATRDTWTDRKELKTFTNISVRLPGDKPQRIVLAAHHDTKCTTGHQDPQHNFHFVGANDGASGVALLLALAPVLQAMPRRATIELLFLDGEESLDWGWNEGARALFGSKRHARRHRDALLLGDEARIEAFVLLDMVGRRELHIQEELYSTPLLRQLAWSAAVATGHEKSFFQRAEAASDDHTPYLEAGIPSLDLIDLNGNPHWHQPTDTIDNMAPTSLQTVADVVLTMLPEIERIYVLGQ